MNIEYNNYQDSYNNGKNKNKKLLIIGIGIIAITISVFCFIFLRGKKSSENVDSILSNSFFLSNNEGNYALFNYDGKQLTDFEYKVGHEVINGSAIVENSEYESAIISDTGKILVDFGVYKIIDRRGSLYVVEDEEYNQYLLDSSGKQIKKLVGETVTSYRNEYHYVLLESETDYTVLDYNGKKIVSFDKVDSDDVESPITHSSENYATIFYNNTNYIINTLEKKLIHSFNEKQNYCINEVSDDNTIVVLSACTPIWGEEVPNNFKVFKNNKLKFELNNSDCSNIVPRGDNIVCYYTDDYSVGYDIILDDNGQKTIEMSNEINFSGKHIRNAYINEDNYAQSTGDITDGVDIYHNGTKTHIDCMRLSENRYMHSGIYILQSFSRDEGSCQGTESGYKLYNQDGTPIDNVLYKEAFRFNTLNLAQVKYNKEDELTTLINNKGEALLTGEKFNEIRSGKLGEIYVSVTNDAICTTYQLDTKKEVAKTTKCPWYGENYFSIEEEGKIKYYSYSTGELFHEKSK